MFSSIGDHIDSGWCWRGRVSNNQHSRHVQPRVNGCFLLWGHLNIVIWPEPTYHVITRETLCAGLSLGPHILQVFLNIPALERLGFSTIHLRRLCHLVCACVAVFCSRRFWDTPVPACGSSGWCICSFAFPPFPQRPWVRKINFLLGCHLGKVCVLCLSMFPDEI